MTTTAYTETNAEVIEKALYCLKHGELESVENWLDLLRERVSSQPAAAPIDIEAIAAQWDGCMYQGVGQDVDIGAAIRNAAKRFSAPSPAAKQAEFANALAHIARVADGSREQSRRIRWIALRAHGALDGTDDWRTIKLPRNDAGLRVRLKARVAELEAENERLRAASVNETGAEGAQPETPSDK